MEYQLTVNDINSSLVFMYTPVTDEGVKGEPQCTMTDFVKAGTVLCPGINPMFSIVLLQNICYMYGWVESFSPIMFVRGSNAF